jgi:hypothetical protein
MYLVNNINYVHYFFNESIKFEKIRKDKSNFVYTMKPKEIFKLYKKNIYLKV